MNLQLFAGAILGHFVGDYLLQNQWMALNKSKQSRLGLKACTVHVLLYTLAVACFTTWDPRFLLVVAVPHWIIDHWSLGLVWLYFKNGYGLKEIWNREPDMVSRVWAIAFAAPVYIFNDNTMHWVCLWLTVKWLG